MTAAVAMPPAAPVWLPEREPAPRACQLCDYGRQQGQVCVHVDVGGQPTSRARVLGGACGPEAQYLTIKGTRL